MAPECSMNDYGPPAPFVTDDESDFSDDQYPEEGYTNGEHRNIGGAETPYTRLDQGSTSWKDVELDEYTDEGLASLSTSVPSTPRRKMNTNPKRKYKKAKYQYSESKADGYDIKLCHYENSLTQTEPSFFIISLPAMAAVSKSLRRSSTTMSNTPLSEYIKTAQATQYLCRSSVTAYEMLLPKPGETCPNDLRGTVQEQQLDLQQLLSDYHLWRPGFFKRRTLPCSHDGGMLRDELKLFVNAFLLDHGIFTSWHDLGRLTSKHWQDITQAKLERDLAFINTEYHAAGSLALDLVAVHGLTGSPRRTWTNGNALKLPSEIDVDLRPRLFTWGYHKNLSSVPSEQRICDLHARHRGDQIRQAFRNNDDDEAKALASEGSYLMSKPCLNLAVQMGDFDMARFLDSEEYPMCRAAKEGDQQLVTRLIQFGIDCNDGPSIFERPLQIAILHDHLAVAKLLWSHYATADLGHLVEPLSDALATGDLAQARSILQMPRRLTEQDAHKSFFLMLRKLFKLEHENLLSVVSCDSSAKQATTERFREIGLDIHMPEQIWATGMSTIKKLTKGFAPKNFAQLLSLLTVARAMSAVSIYRGEFRTADLFLYDLERWRFCTDQYFPKDLPLFDEVVWRMWGKLESSILSNDWRPPREEWEPPIAHLINITTDLVANVMGELSIFQATFPNCASHSSNFHCQVCRPPTCQADSPTKQVSSSLSANSPAQQTLSSLSHASVEWEPGIPLSTKIAIVLMLGATFAIIVCTLLGTLSSIQVIPHV